MTKTNKERIRQYKFISTFGLTMWEIIQIQEELENEGIKTYYCSFSNKIKLHLQS